MAVLELVGIVPDGGDYGPGVPVDPRQVIKITQGASCIARLRLFHPSGSPVDLRSVSSTHVLSVKKNPQDFTGPVSRNGFPNLLIGINVVDFELIPNDTKNIEPGNYGYDIASTINTVRDFTVPLSPWKIEPAVGQLGAPVTSVTSVPLTTFGLPLNGLVGQTLQITSLNPFTVAWLGFAGVTFPAVKGALATADSDVGFNGQRLTGMADGINPTDGATVGQLPVVPPQVPPTFTEVKNALAAATSDVGFNAKKLTSVANGVNPTDAATVGQLPVVPPQVPPTFTEVKNALAVATSDVGFNSKKLASVAAGVAPTDAANVSQLSGTSPSFNTLTLIDQAAARTLIYVRTGGSDVTGTGTLALPYATVPRAIQDIPSVFFNKRYVIDCSGMGTVAITSPINLFGRMSDRPTYSVGNPEFVPWASIEGSITIQAVPTLAYTLGTVTITTHDLTTNFKTYEDLSQSWAPDELVGMWLNDPALFGRTAQIVTNTATTLTVASNIAYTASPGTLRIYQPSTTFQDTTGVGNLAFQDLDCGVVLRGLKLTTTVNLSTQLIVQRCRNQVLVHMCDVLYLTATSADVRFFTSLLRCKLITAKMSLTDAILNLQNAVLLDWNALSVSAVQQSQILGSQVAFVRCGGFQSSVSEFSVTTAWWLGGNGIYRQSAAGGNSTGLGWTLVGFMFENVVSTSTYPAAINCFGPGVTHVSVCASMGSLPDYGALLGDGAQLKLITSTSLPTGTISDMKVGSNAARTIAHFNSIQPLQNECDVFGSGSRLYLSGSVLIGPAVMLPRLHPFTSAARPSGANQPPDGTVIWNTTEKDINVSDGISWYRNGVVDP